MRVPDSKSMPKLMPLPAIASAPISRITPDTEKNHFDAPMKSKVILCFACPAPSAERLLQDLRAAQAEDDRLGREHRREQREHRPDAEHEREALDARRREDEEDERDEQRDDVGVDDRREALLVARGEARGHGSARAHLFLDALEDDDVGVGRHPQCEDQARDARQRQRDRDQLDQRVEVERVDAERDGRDDAEHAVEDEQEERDDREAGDARLEALVERLLAERGRDLRARDQLELQRQGADLEHLRQVLRARDREAAGDLRAGRAVDAVRVLAVVDERDRDELVVERDREVVRARDRVGVQRVGVVGAALGDLAR